MKINFIDKLFFKKRTLFFIDKQKYKFGNLINSNFEVAIYDNNNLAADLKEYLYKKIKQEIIETRLMDADCFLAIAINKENCHPAGYCWMVRSVSNIRYHDNFFIPRYSALVFNAYIEPEYRRMKVYRLLQSSLHDYLFKVANCEMVFTIVENRNLPAYNACIKFGLEKYSFNYLIKFFGKNMFSIYKDNEKILIKYLSKKIDFILR